MLSSSTYIYNMSVTHSFLLRWQLGHQKREPGCWYALTQTGTKHFLQPLSNFEFSAGTSKNPTTSVAPSDMHLDLEISPLVEHKCASRTKVIVSDPPLKLAQTMQCPRVSNILSLDGIAKHPTYKGAASTFQNIQASYLQPSARTSSPTVSAKVSTNPLSFAPANICKLPSRRWIGQNLKLRHCGLKSISDCGGN